MIIERLKSLSQHQTNKNPRSSQRKLISFFVLAVPITLLALWAFTMTRNVADTRQSLQHALDHVQSIRISIENEDLNSSIQSYDLLVSETSSAREITSSPSWKFATLLPVVGQNFGAVSIVALSVDEIATDVVGPLLDEYRSFEWDNIRQVDGSFDISKVAEVEPTLTSATRSLHHSKTRVDGIHLDSLIPELGSQVRSLQETLKTAVPSLEAASTAARLVPPMLGSDSPRRYLVLIQNNAELRATGGIPGALAIIRAEGGRVFLGDQASAAQLSEFIPMIAVDQHQQELFTTRIGRHMQNVNLTPDFPTAASTAKLMWEERYPGQPVDGVIALDPVVLSLLLNAIGPVSISDPDALGFISETELPMELTGDNVVPTLLSKVYSEIESPSRQDQYFSSVASHVFEAITDGRSSSVGLLEALARSADEQRLYLWSGHVEEQDLISATALSGAAVGPNSGGASFGMYFNDGTGAKMDYYVNRKVQLIEGCRADGYNQYTMRATITNSAPVDAAESLPPYVTGAGAFGVSPGNVRTNYVAYGPAQSLLKMATVNGAPVSFSSGTHEQRPVATVTVELAPGQSAAVEFMFTRVVQNSEPELSVTPTSVPRAEVVLPLHVDPECG